MNFQLDRDTVSKTLISSVDRILNHSWILGLTDSDKAIAKAIRTIAESGTPEDNSVLDRISIKATSLWES